MVTLWFQKPFDIFSPFDALLVRFRSDDTFVSQGFSIVYEAVEDTYSEEDEV